MIRRLVLSLALCTATLARAAAPATPAPLAPPEASAKQNEFDQQTGEAVLSGDARLSDGTLLLLADDIRYNTKTNVATASGNIQFTRGPIRLLADRLVYNRVDGTFTAENIRLGSHPYFVEGFSASGTQNEITVKRARASYGEPGPWQPTINADTIIFSPGQKLRSENVTLGIGHTQPVPIPRFEHNLSAPLFGTGSLNGGYRRSLGVFAEAALHAPLAPSLRLGVDLGVYTQRGVMIGPSGRYADAKDPEKLSGYFRSGYINDHGEKGTDNVFEAPVPEHRAYAEWHHRQQLTPDLTVFASGHWWKDPEVYRDFRSRSFFPLQEPDTFAEAVYSGDNYYVSLFARFQPNRFHRVQERLPELRFDLLPHTIGPGFVQRFNASAAYLREDPLYSPTRFAMFPVALTAISPVLLGNGPQIPAAPVALGTIDLRTVTTIGDSTYGPAVFWARDRENTLISGPSALIAGPAYTLQTRRLDAYYGLERPFSPREWLTVSPIAGGRLTHYMGSRIGASRLDDYTRALGELGVDAALRTSGTFDYKNPQWKIDGLRHLFTPRVSYRYISDPGQDRFRFPRIDRDVFSTYLQPLGLGDRRNIDDIPETNTLRLSLDNILQTRDGTEGTRDLLALNLANDFRFYRRPGERDVSETHVELAVMPARWLQVDLYQSFAPQSLTLRELNSGVTIRDGRAWSLRFANNFLRSQLQDYLLDGRVRLNERLDLAARLHYDARKRRFNEQTYGLVQNLGNTWLISYNVSIYSGRRRESSFGFNIQIDTVRF